MCCCAALHTHAHTRSVRAQGQTRLRQSIESRILVEALTGANAHPRAAAHESRAPACRGGAVPTVLTRRLTRRTALPHQLEPILYVRQQHSAAATPQAAAQHATPPAGAQYLTYSEWLFISCDCLPVATSQIRTVLSTLPLATYFPSGEKSTDLTQA